MGLLTSTSDSGFQLTFGGGGPSRCGASTAEPGAHLAGFLIRGLIQGSEKGVWLEGELERGTGVDGYEMKLA